MTDAEKMREAAAQWCADEADRCEDAAKWGGHRKYVQDCKAAAYALRNAWSKIRALPVDASAPAADCQQAGLVTAGAVEVCGICDIPGCYHIRERQAYVRQCTDQNPIKNLPPGLLDEVKAALALLTERARGLVFAHHHGNGLEGWHNTVDGVDRAITAAQAALARLEREVG